MHIHIFPDPTISGAAAQTPIQTGNYSKEKEPEEYKEKPQMVSIFSQYDTSHDKNLSYQQDSDTKQFIDAGQTKQDFTSGLEKNILSKIKVDVKSLWNSAVGNFSQSYESNDVEKSNESSAQSKINSDTKAILSEQIQSANQILIDAYTKAIEEAKAELAKESEKTETTDNNTQKPNDAGNNTPKTIDDLKNAGIKFKTRSREINGQKQEYIMYKDSSGETQRAVVNEDGSLDPLHQTNEWKGQFSKKKFVTESILKEKFGDKYDIHGDDFRKNVINSLEYSKKDNEMDINFSGNNGWNYTYSVDEAISSGAFDASMSGKDLSQVLGADGKTSRPGITTTKGGSFIQGKDGKQTRVYQYYRGNDNKDQQYCTADAAKEKFHISDEQWQKLENSGANIDNILQNMDDSGQLHFTGSSNLFSVQEYNMPLDFAIDNHIFSAEDLKKYLKAHPDEK